MIRVVRRQEPPWVDLSSLLQSLQTGTPVPPRSAPRGRKPAWSERGSAAVDLGDLEAARLCFAQAVRAEPGNARHCYRLAIVQEALGELGAAGASLTEALRLDPRMAEAARRLALLAGRCDLAA